MTTRCGAFILKLVLYTDGTLRVAQGEKWQQVSSTPSQSHIPSHHPKMPHLAPETQADFAPLQQPSSNQEIRQGQQQSQVYKRGPIRLHVQPCSQGWCRERRLRSTKRYVTIADAHVTHRHTVASRPKAQYREYLLTHRAIGTSGPVKLAKKEAKPAAAPKAAASKVRIPVP
jgi:hypothetical protein